MGSNMAENHPVGFRFVMKAKTRGATIIHIDPRFSRTSAMADYYVPLRAGSDLVFLGALVSYVLEREALLQGVRRWRTPTPPPSSPTTSRTPKTWTACSAASIPGAAPTRPTPGSTPAPSPAKARPSTTARTPSRWGTARAARTRTTSHSTRRLQHPRCVFQILKRHYRRYTPEMVEEACGVPRDQFLKIAETIVANSGRERTTSFAYAVAWTQHTTGTQIISLLRHPPAPARQHRAAGRRHHGAAGPRHDPGQHRHPDPLQPPARLPADAERPGRPQGSRELPGRRRHADRRLVQRAALHGQPAQGVVRRRRHARQRLRLPEPAEARRRLLVPADAAGDEGRPACAACSAWARTRPSGRRTPSWCARGSPSSTGWSSATSSRPRRPRSGRTRPRCWTARSRRPRSAPKSS